jgi:hypothetical protein
MTSPMIGTLTRTATITLTNVRDVFWRIQTDLRVLRAQHGMITAEYEEQVAADLLLFIYRNYIKVIEFRFTNRTTGQRMDGSTQYDISRNFAGSADDDGGGLRQRNLSQAEFNIVVWYSDVWKTLTESERAAFRNSLKLTWGLAADAAPGGGAWVSDRTYASGSLSATRSVFRAS